MLCMCILHNLSYGSVVLFSSELYCASPLHYIYPHICFDIIDCTCNIALALVSHINRSIKRTGWSMMPLLESGPPDMLYQWLMIMPIITPVVPQQCDCLNNCGILVPIILCVVYCTVFWMLCCLLFRILHIVSLLYIVFFVVVFVFVFVFAIVHCFIVLTLSTVLASCTVCIYVC